MDDLDRELESLWQADARWRTEAPLRPQVTEAPMDPTDRMELVIEALREVLIEKGLITEDELETRVRELAREEEEDATDG